MPPGPERRRIIGTPFAADQGLLDRDAVRTRLTSVNNKAIAAIANRCTPARNKQMYRIAKISPSVMGRILIDEIKRKMRVKKRGKSGRRWVFAPRLKHAGAREFHRRSYLP